MEVKSTDWQKLDGKRVLVTDNRRNSWDNSVIEVFVMEVAPSGQRVKLRFPSAMEIWVGVGQYSLIEVLIGKR